MAKKRRWHCLSGVPPTEMDKTIMYWESKNKLVPTRELIKTPEQIEAFKQRMAEYRRKKNEQN